MWSDSSSAVHTGQRYSCDLLAQVVRPDAGSTVTISGVEIPMPLLDIDYADATRYAELLGIVRIAIGLAAWAVPDRITEPWVGPTVDRDTRTVLTRALGGRDIALALGALLAAR